MADTETTVACKSCQYRYEFGTVNACPHCTYPVGVYVAGPNVGMQVDSSLVAAPAEDHAE